jgi:hypothetical protein
MCDYDKASHWKVQSCKYTPQGVKLCSFSVQTVNSICHQAAESFAKIGGSVSSSR